MSESATWLLTFASLAGVLLNIHHRRECFIVWGITNASWAVVDFLYGIPSQGTLQAVYCGLSVYGWVAWRKG